MWVAAPVWNMIPMRSIKRWHLLPLLVPLLDVGCKPAIQHIGEQKRAGHPLAGKGQRLKIVPAEGPPGARCRIRALVIGSAQDRESVDERTACYPGGDGTIR